MKGRATLLVEIGCEEIPARMLPAGARAVADAVTGILDRSGIAHGQARPLWTPRRLAVLVPATEGRTPGAEKIVTGPPASAAWDAQGQPTRAAAGFAAKHGARPADLIRHRTERGLYAALRVVVEPRPLERVLAEELPRAIARLSFPKTMRWGSGRYQFVRPVHWLVVLHGEEALAAELFGVRAGRETRGHRVLAPGPHEVPEADAWESVLERAYVVADPDRRREALARALAGRAEEAGGRLAEDPALLEEVADMLEWPAAVAGSFEARFVESLPAAVLETCLRHHQKAFLVRGADGAILPAFAVGVNMPSDPGGHIRRGHEWVVGGRLEDALFFWREDRTRPLGDRRPGLDGVLFHERLGHCGAKTERVERLAGEMAEACGLDTRAAAAVRRAAFLSRCDLLTGTVGEFPELQGTAGALLAEADGEAPEVVAALRAFHDPPEALPEGAAGLVAAVLGIADRLDTLAGCFGIGLVPSGSRDPFALRRAGTTAVRLAFEVPSCDLRWGVDRAVAGYAEQGIELGGGVRDSLGEFLFERFARLAQERLDARHDEIAAVRRFARERFDARDLLERVAQLKSFRKSEDFLALAAAAKRVRNILRQAASRGDRIEPGAARAGDAEPAEGALAREIDRVGPLLSGAAARGAYAEALSALASLRPAIDRFFDEVLVMDERAEVRRARLGLLARFDELARGIVDVAELAVEGPRAAGG